MDPEVEFVARQETDRALRDTLAYQLYVDLPPGRQVTQPDLEQCGLLKSIEDPPPDLFVTAALLVLQGRRPPIVYDLTIRPVPADLGGPLSSAPPPAAGRRRKATDGKAKGGGRTLRERAAAGDGSHRSTARRPGGPGPE